MGDQSEATAFLTRLAPAGVPLIRAGRVVLVRRKHGQLVERRIGATTTVLSVIVRDFLSNLQNAGGQPSRDFSFTDDPGLSARIDTLLKSPRPTTLGSVDSPGSYSYALVIVKGREELGTYIFISKILRGLRGKEDWELAKVSGNRLLTPTPVNDSLIFDREWVCCLHIKTSGGALGHEGSTIEAARVIAANDDTQYQQMLDYFVPEHHDIVRRKRVRTIKEAVAPVFELEHDALSHTRANKRIGALVATLRQAWWRNRTPSDVYAAIVRARTHTDRLPDATLVQNRVRLNGPDAQLLNVLDDGVFRRLLSEAVEDVEQFFEESRAQA